MSALRDHTQRILSSGKKGLAPFFTAGYPDEETFLDLVAAATRAGADMLEIGVPFSDPVADGPVIQASSQKALEECISLEKVLALTEKVSHSSSAALVLMGYLNPFLRMGIDQFAKRAKEAGAHGVIIPDLPLEESLETREILAAKDITLVDLIAPTTSEARAAKMAECSDGFIYLVSLTGVTGVRSSVASDLGSFVQRVRAHTTLPLYVGFGVSDSGMARDTVRHADGVIIGSAIVKLIDESKSKNEAIEKVESFLTGIRQAIDA